MELSDQVCALTVSPLGNSLSTRCIGGNRGGTVVKVLRYKSEGCWFDPKWCQWNFSLT